MEKKLTGVGNPQDEKEKRRALLRGLRTGFEVSCQVIRALEKAKAEAVGILVTQEMSMENEKETISDNVHGEVAMASTTIYNKKCHHCGRPEHVKADCFHNPGSASYRPYQERKGLKYQSNSNKGGKMENVLHTGQTENIRGRETLESLDT